MTGHAGWMSETEFEEAVADALDEVPQQWLDGLQNVVFTVQPEPTSEQRTQTCQPGQDLLGLYVGVPQPQRSDGYAAVMPDTIFLFSGPIQRNSISKADAVEQIRVTLLHEMGHHYGMSDGRLRELGY